MLFRHIIIVYPENQKHIRKLCDPNAEFLNVKASSIYSKHCDLKSLKYFLYHVKEQQRKQPKWAHPATDTPAWWDLQRQILQFPDSCKQCFKETSEFRNYLSTVTNSCLFVRSLCVLLSTIAYSDMMPPETLQIYSPEVC